MGKEKPWGLITWMIMGILSTLFALVFWFRAATGGQPADAFVPFLLGLLVSVAGLVFAGVCVLAQKRGRPFAGGIFRWGLPAAAALSLNLFPWLVLAVHAELTAALWTQGQTHRPHFPRAPLPSPLRR